MPSGAQRPRRSAHERALDALARRPRAAQELTRWLRDRGYDAAEVGAVIERLTVAGLLDDARFAESFARSRLIDRRLSRRRVLAELARRGVGREVASSAVASVLADEGIDECEAVYLVAEKKYRSLASLDPAVAARRLTGFLARRGYGRDAIRGAIRRLLAG